VNRASGLRTIFITGTDTGVGKTVLTALLLAHLRSRGRRALAIKPFCSGDRADARLFWLLEDRELALGEINPFYFRPPLAPLAAARQRGKSLKLPQVVASVREAARHLLPRNRFARRALANGVDTLAQANPPCLLVEGAGGVMVPLAQDFSVLDLIARLRSEVIVVARNRLGTLNHTLLTVRALQQASKPASLKVVLMDPLRPDLSSASNPSILRGLLAPVPIYRLPFLAGRLSVPATIRHHARRLDRAVTRLLA